MVHRRIFTPDKILFLLLFIASVLIGCSTFEGSNNKSVVNMSKDDIEAVSAITTTPTPTIEITPTRTLDLYRPDTVRATYAAEATQKAGRPTSTPKPSPSPTLNTKLLCQPFPESMRYLGSTQILGFPAWTIRGQCQGEKTHFRSPVGEMTLYDYTSLTGRFAYGPPDSSNDGLWVYDYWTELSEKWSDDAILQAEWSLLKNAQDIQQLGILSRNGTLYVASGPFQMETISENVSSFSIEPTGKRLAYVKEQVLYVVGMNGGQPRKLAEEVNGKPVWVRDGNAIIFPSSPIKIAYLDGSSSFTPQQLPSVLSRLEYLCEGKQNCTFPTKKSADHLLWNETSNLLVFYSFPPSEEENYQHIYVYELSEDLRKIVNFQRIIGEFSGQIDWNIYGESLVDSDEQIVKLGLPPEFHIALARINTMSGNELGVEFTRIETMHTSDFSHHFTHVILTDEVKVYDKSGNETTIDAVTPGMTIQLTGRRISPYTLSLFADTIQIYCDQQPCYLGFEGRS